MPDDVQKITDYEYAIERSRPIWTEDSIAAAHGLSLAEAGYSLNYTIHRNEHGEEESVFIPSHAERKLIETYRVKCLRIQALNLRTLREGGGHECGSGHGKGAGEAPLLTALSRSEEAL